MITRLFYKCSQDGSVGGKGTDQGTISTLERLLPFRFGRFNTTSQAGWFVANLRSVLEAVGFEDVKHMV